MDKYVTFMRKTNAEGDTTHDGRRNQTIKTSNFTGIKDGSVMKIIRMVKLYKRGTKRRACISIVFISMLCGTVKIVLFSYARHI